MAKVAQPRYTGGGRQQRGLVRGPGLRLISRVIETNHPEVQRAQGAPRPLSAADRVGRPALTKASRAIDRSIEQGSLIVNYLGHGGKGLDRRANRDMPRCWPLRNANNLTFFTTGTCDFSTYDNPDFTSAGR
jgi:hypothetical protein